MIYDEILKGKSRLKMDTCSDILPSFAEKGIIFFSLAFADLMINHRWTLRDKSLREEAQIGHPCSISQKFKFKIKVFSLLSYVFYPQNNPGV